MVFWPPTGSKVSGGDSSGVMGSVSSFETFEGVPVVVDEFYGVCVVCAVLGKV